MRTVIIDSSCLIDLKKGELLETIFSLSYRFAIPEVLFEDELLSVHNTERKRLKNLGLEIIELSGDGTRLASELLKKHSGISLNDCLALVSAKQIPNSILLTGDKTLRHVTIRETRVEVHGVLWIMDELAAHKVVDRSILLKALDIFKKNKMVFLPEEEIEKRIRKLKRSI